MKTDDELKAIARDVFPGAEDITVTWSEDGMRARVQMDGKITFTFASMAKLAGALGTDRLNFFSDHGDPGQMGSSWTGRYGEEDGFFAFEASW